MRRTVAGLLALFGILVARGVCFGAEPAAWAWAEILRAHVNTTGEVAYARLAGKEKTLVSGLVDWLAAAPPPGPDRDAVMAFWINAYNATALLAVLRGESPEQPTSRVRMFATFHVKVAGRERTLDEMGAVLDTVARVDPRIHLALCAAARDSPALPPEPYVGERLDAQLAEAARRFVQTPRGARFDVERKRVELSEVFRWYRKDFERAGGSVANFVADLLPEGPVPESLAVGGFTIVFRPFDWTLNAQPGERPR